MVTKVLTRSAVAALVLIVLFVFSTGVNTLVNISIKLDPRLSSLQNAQAASHSVPASEDCGEVYHQWPCPPSAKLAHAASQPAQAGENCGWIWMIAKDALKKARVRDLGGHDAVDNEFLSLANAANNLYRTCIGR